jgi:hypothetical protein
MRNKMVMRTAFVEIAEVTYDNERSLLRAKIHENAEMNLRNIKEFFECVKDLTGHKKHLVLIDAAQYFALEPETLEYIAKAEISSNRIATAYYNVGMANRLTLNFFKYSYLHLVPMQVFDTEASARQWLHIVLNEKTN